MAYDGIVSRYLNRPISRPAARALQHTPATPNTITVSTLLLSIATATAIATGYNIIGGIGIQLASIIDGIDGELARLQNTTTRFGAVLDAVTDRYADAAIIAGLTIYATRFEPHPHPEALGLLALAGTLIVSYSRARIEASLFPTTPPPPAEGGRLEVGDDHTSTTPPPPESGTLGVEDLPPPTSNLQPSNPPPTSNLQPSTSLFGLASRDVRTLLMAIGAILGLAYATLAVIATITTLTIAWRLIYLRITKVGG